MGDSGLSQPIQCAKPTSCLTAEIAVGITHLKLVGRGNYVDFMEKDIRNLKTALDILEHVDTEEEYIRDIKRTLFPYGCSGLCYYRETESVAGKTI